MLKALRGDQQKHPTVSQRLQSSSCNPRAKTKAKKLRVQVWSSRKTFQKSARKPEFSCIRLRAIFPKGRQFVLHMNKSTLKIQFDVSFSISKSIGPKKKMFRSLGNCLWGSLGVVEPYSESGFELGIKPQKPHKLIGQS